MKIAHRNLALLLLQAREAVMSGFRPLLAQSGLTEQQWRIIRTLSERGPMEPGRIAETCCVLSPSLTGILSRMVALDLVTRAQSEADQRRQRVALTPRSEAIVKRMAPLIDAQYRTLEARWGTKTLSDLYSMLDRMLGQDAEPGKPSARPTETTRARVSRALEHTPRKSGASGQRRGAILGTTRSRAAKGAST